jgi:PIN domain nuclease of toxin-antitoxin system
MRALLDTHTFLWWNMGHPRLSERAREIIADGGNEIWFSAASAWEIALKAGKGRLLLPEPPREYVLRRLTLHGFHALAVEASHALAVYALPGLHSDPFDRLLVAQSRAEELPLLSADPEIARYDVEVVW